MNCSPTIAIALLLISLSAGIFLLFKAKKESLGMLFKLVAWLIIIVSIGCMVCCGMRCISKCCGKNKECGKEEKCEMQMGGGMHGMHGRCCMMKERSCCEGKEEECSDSEKSCCASGDDHCEKKVEVKIDTVINKH